jgi:hypothetical protein
VPCPLFPAPAGKGEGTFALLRRTTFDRRARGKMDAGTTVPITLKKHCFSARIDVLYIIKNLYAIS